jgi:predicted glutamine amidotransferase
MKANDKKGYVPALQQLIHKYCRSLLSGILAAMHNGKIDRRKSGICPSLLANGPEIAYVLLLSVDIWLIS